MGEITLQSIIVRTTGVVAADMDGETVMMSIENGRYYNLGKTGGAIWALSEQPVAVEELIERLLAKYEVTRQQCETDVLAFLQEACQEGLLELQ